MKEYWKTYLISLYNDIPSQVYYGLLFLYCIGAVTLLVNNGLKIGWRKAINLLLLEYIFLLYFSMVVFRPLSEEVKYDFQPFWTYTAIGGGQIDLIPEIIMNVVVFAPVGILLGSLLRVKGSWLIALAVGMGISISIEAMQFVFHRGFAEMDDVMHNALGCLIGFMIVKILKGLWQFCSYVFIPQRRPKEI